MAIATIEKNMSSFIALLLNYEKKNKKDKNINPTSPFNSNKFKLLST